MESGIETLQSLDIECLSSFGVKPTSAPNSGEVDLILAREFDKVLSTAYSVTQEQNIYDYCLVSSIRAGEKGR